MDLSSVNLVADKLSVCVGFGYNVIMEEKKNVGVLALLLFLGYDKKYIVDTVLEIALSQANEDFEDAKKFREGYGEKLTPKEAGRVVAYLFDAFLHQCAVEELKRLRDEG